VGVGTIIRLCDWFGIEQLVCSTDTVDCFNPKVVQAAMGSTARVNINYEDLLEYINASNIPVYGGCMSGYSVYKEHFPEELIIVVGNEANGISDVIINSLTRKITIPQFGDNKETESLNVATATAILLSEIKRAL
jgi:rRNA methylases